tara:strand:- start:396 stop:1274 length:879 start_codon:yes stop_codon:yes gene_type:complete
MKGTNSSKAAHDAGLTSKDITQLIDIAKECARAGGQVLMSYYGKLDSVKSKRYEGDLVTDADIAAEKKVLEILNSKTPNIDVLAEESGRRGTENNLQWCVDPLDGTTNFTHSYPFFATSVGLTWKGIPILGSIDIPSLKENYWAAPGVGAYCNEKIIRTSQTSKLSKSLLVTGFGYDRQQRLDNNYAEFCWLTHRTRGVRRGGAAAVDLAFIACGRVDGYWERGLSEWDLAAGVVIVELAGGSVSDYYGNNFDLSSGRILACSPGIKAELIAVLKQVKPLMGEMYGAPEITD